MLLLLYALLHRIAFGVDACGRAAYSDTMDARDAHAKQRSGALYIQSQRQRAAAQGNIRLIDGPEGPAVCLREPESDFRNAHLFI